MFNKDFYPTPPEVIHRMLAGLDLNGKTVLEPSAGKGDIVEVLKKYGAKTIVCEYNDDLARISGSKADRFLKNDFILVKKEEISHVDYIIMNPPFSTGDVHIKHAFDIAPDGCHIIALCNHETYNNSYSHRRKSLKGIISDNGTYENLGDVFRDSERTTGVSVGLINIFKPKAEGEDEFEGYFDMTEDQAQLNEGLVKHSFIEEIVGRYVSSVKMFDSVIEKSEEINKMVEPIQGSYGIKFGAYRTSENNYHAITREIFKKDLQKSAWKKLFNQMDLKKYVTSKVMENINKFVEQQENVPFTVKNVFKMYEMIYGTRESRMKQVIVEVFDTLTKHHHDNRFQLEGWKTNSEYRVNKKFIRGYGDISTEWGGLMKARWSPSMFMDDLNKALCYVTGTPFNQYPDWYEFMQNKQTVPDRHLPDRTEISAQYREFGKWYDWGFFEIKGFKKGTLHVKFKSEEVWNQFNKIACEAKGFALASKYTSDMRRKKTDLELY